MRIQFNRGKWKKVLVDFAKTRHEHADLLSLFVGALRQHARDVAHVGFRKVGGQMLRDVKDARLAHSDYVVCETDMQSKYFWGKIQAFTRVSEGKHGVLWSFCILQRSCTSGSAR